MENSVVQVQVLVDLSEALLQALLVTATLQATSVVMGVVADSWEALLQALSTIVTPQAR